MSAVHTPAPAPTPAAPRLVTPILVGGCLVLFVAFGIRSAFGLFQIPIAAEFGWPRAEYSLAIAVQNIVWGVAQPAFAALAERWGDRRALTLGAVVYALGLAGSAVAVTPEAHQALNILIGCGIAGTGFGVILAMVGKAAAEEHRSLALGVATAAASAGQFLMAPLIGAALEVAEWQRVFLLCAGGILAVLLLLPLLRPVGDADAAPAAPGEGLWETLGRAARDPSYTMIFLGFFSCGYQLGFVTAHFPAFIAEACGPLDPAGILAGLGVTGTEGLGALAMGLIGAANIGGTLLAGRLGARYPRRLLLAGIYTLRTLAAAAFLLIPMTPATVLIFSGVMGALWLATVPLTASLVGHIYGLRHMGTLYGFVFLSHQIGSFMGVWLGGALYDRYGGYDAVWWIGVGVGAFSAVIHLPVRERPLAMPGAAAAAA